jgi:gamma-glutamyltranspeptidase/glutathione hydrolase
MIDGNVKRLLLPALTAMMLLGQEDEGPDVIRNQARSMVMTTRGIVATSQTLASAAGVKILEAGGSAVDAAIAANAVLGLTEPTGSGIGGDLFAIVYDAKSGKLHGLNSSGWSPTGLTIEQLTSKGETKMPMKGIDSVTVPGAVAGWEALHQRFGRLPLSRSLQPAIHYAKQGFPVTELIAASWSGSKARPVLTLHENATRLFMPNGRGLQEGEIFRNPLLARSLERIAAAGRDGFYRGPTAEAIVAISKELGGTMTLADLAEFQPEWVDPISTEYHGWTVAELPPNGQGIAALAMLNIMEQFPLREYGAESTKALHVMIEAKKLAYADLLQYVGDPRFSKIPVEQMVSKKLGIERAKMIDTERATCKAVPSQLISTAKLPGADTIYLSVVDREGNMVSFIQSNYSGFGSGVVPSGTGFMLHNRGGLFTLEPNQPNSLAPRKRPIHTIIPGFLSKGSTRIAFGIMGGWNQAQAHAQFVSNLVDHGMNIQAAMEAPRFTKLTFEGCDVQIESRIAESTRSELSKLGHDVRVAGPYSQRVGGGQAVMRNEQGTNFGASDPRKDGAALPESPGFAPVVRKK